MALHWAHVKGFNATSSSDTLYTFLNFRNNKGQDDPNSNLLPIVITNTNNRDTAQSGDDLHNLGHIITSNCAATFLQYMIFNSGATFNATSWIAADTWLKFGSDSSYITGNSSQLTINHNTKLQFNGAATFANAITANSTLDVTGVVTCSSACNATYFNATSDRRAKDNLIPYSGSALDIVNQTQIYTFNYRKDPLHRTIGVIAQDLMDLNLDGASLVDNIKATGRNDDFMQLHESKLIYVLWKAVQELSLEVKILKEKLGE